MTAKEAIKNIKGLLDGCCGPELDDTREAFGMAIKALEAQECEDAVGRKSVLSALREEDRGGYIDYATEYVLGVIRRLPSVTPSVILCEDCAFSREDVIFGGLWCQWSGRKTKPGYFCGDAERRNDG